MTYPAGTIQARINGIFGTAANPVEQWSFGVHVEGGIAEGDLNSARLGAAGGLWDVASAYISNQSNEARFQDSTILTEVQAAHLNPDGSLVGGSYTRYSGNPVPGFSAAPQSLPVDISYVITLDAGVPKAGRFGRFYPPPQPTAVTFGLSSAASADDRLAAAATLLHGICVALGTTIGGDIPVQADAVLVVASKVHNINREVVQIRSGRVPDVQRRRRNALQEDYHVTAFAQ